MRKIKSAPANLCDMIHRKKKSCSNQINLINSVNSVNSKICQIVESDNIIENQENQEISDKKEINKDIENNNNKFKQIPLKKKRISTIHTAIITDTYFEFAKKIPDIDNYYFNGLIDIVNSFVSNKFNKQNLENLILSIIIRLIFSTICHDIIVNINKIDIGTLSK